MEPENSRGLLGCIPWLATDDKDRSMYHKDTGNYYTDSDFEKPMMNWPLMERVSKGPTFSCER